MAIDRLAGGFSAEAAGLANESCRVASGMLARDLLAQVLKHFDDAAAVPLHLR
jgi:hypothetical protein